MFKKYNLDNHRQFFVFLFIVFLKFFIARTLLFEGTNFFQTAFVELGYLLIIFGLMEFFASTTLKKLLYITLNLVFSSLLFAILLYHDYFGYIVTIHAFSQLGQVDTIKDSIIQLIKPIYLVLYIDFLILAIMAFLQKNKSLAAVETNRNYRFFIGVLLMGAVLTGVNIGIQKDATIANTVVAAEKQGILTYEIIVARDKYTTNKIDSHEELNVKNLPPLIHNIKGNHPLPEDERAYFEIAKDKNIIVIQAEAFQTFPLNLEIEGEEITPFLNDLMKESIYFPNVYQQIGPGNTSDAEFMFNTSLYASPWTATSETFGDRAIPSFPKLVKQEGYTSLTFHANDVTFWNRNHLYPALGFDRFYDIQFFGIEDVIGIGPSDELVYEKALPELKQLYKADKNFYAQFVTLSSHHPFKIPDTKDVIELPEKFDGTLVGDYLKSMNYTDQALEWFVNELKKEAMWEDTILVFYGDHFGLQPNGLEEKDFDLLKDIIGHDYTFLDQFNIPFMITIGDSPTGELINTIGSQIDMMPTVANMIGLSLEDFVYFGQDIVNYPDNLFGMRYYMPVGSFFNREIIFKPEEGFEDGEAYDIHNGKRIKDFSRYERDYHRILELMSLSDNYMNSLEKR